jgi:hypothetical protein
MKPAFTDILGVAAVIGGLFLLALWMISDYSPIAWNLRRPVRDLLITVALILLVSTLIVLPLE